MRKFVDFVTDNPSKIIISIFAIFFFFSYWTKDITIDPDIMRALPKKIPERRYFDRVTDILPGKETIFIALKMKESLTIESINAVYNLTKNLEDIRGVERVLSPTNANNIKGTEEGFEISPNLNGLISSKEELEEFRTKFFSDETMAELLLGKDRKTFLTMLTISKTADSKKVTEHVIKVSEEFEGKNPIIEKIFFAGKPVATYFIGKMIGPDMRKLFSIGIALIFLIFFLYFKSLRGVLIPLFVVIFSVMVPLGTLPLLGLPFSHSLEVMPIIVMTIAVAYSIYFLVSYYQNLKIFTEKKELVRFVLFSLATPVLMSSLTDMAGFLGLNGSGVESLNELGIFTALGIFSGLIVSILFIPSVLILLKTPKNAKTKGELPGSKMAFIGRKVVADRVPILIFFGIIIILMFYGISKLDFETTTVGNLPKDHPLRESDRVINTQFSGSTILDIVIEGKEENTIKNIEVLSAINDLISYAKNLPYVGGARGFSDIVRKMNQVMHGNNKNYYRIPHKEEIEFYYDDGVEKTTKINGQELASQLIQLYEMSASPEDLASMVDTEYKMTKISIFLKNDRRTVLKETERKIKEFAEKKFKDLPVEIQTTGMVKLFIAINDRVVRGQFLSILIALSIVFLITSLMFRSIILGFYSIIPLFFSIIFNFGMMGLLKIKVSLETMVVSSIAIGVGVDYAIQFIYSLREKIRTGLKMEEAIPLVFSERGIAIFLNAIVVALGFFTLYFSSLKQISNMGYLMAQAMITACLGALIILPAIFLQFKIRFLRRAQ